MVEPFVHRLREIAEGNRIICKGKAEENADIW